MKKKEVIEFEQVVECGCGMDVHKETIVATIQGKGIKTQTKSFKSFHYYPTNQKIERLSSLIF